jgi:peptidoglycan/LPS O-acetylase OafA/YrhL
MRTGQVLDPADTKREMQGPCDYANLAPMGHRPTLGAFRFSLAVIVMLSHLAPLPFQFLYSAVHGYIAVITFYVISGYLITNALETFYAGRVREFLINRTLRIYPCYWVVIAVSVLIVLGNGGAEVVGFGRAAVLSFRDYEPSEFVSALFFFDYIGVAWSLWVELCFYVTIAAVYALLGWRFVYLSCFIALGVYMVATAFLDLVWWHPLAHIPYFVLGVALSRLWLGRDSRPASALLIASALVLVFVAFHHAGLGKAHERLWAPIAVSFGPGPFNVVGLSMMLGVLVLALSISVNGALRSADNFLGDLSYPLFLCHYPLNAAVGHYFSGLPDLQRVWLAIAVSLAASVLLWWVVDSRMVGLRDRFRGVRLYSTSPLASSLGRRDAASHA